MIEGERDDRITLAAIGGLVAVAASLAHEALGHGLGCFADGGTVTLLTFLVFRCDGAGVLADGGGPVGAFAVAAAALLALHILRPRPSPASVFALMLAIVTALWVCMQTVSEGLDGSDDWGHVARDLHWRAWWRGVAIAAGAAGYWATLRLATPLARRVAAGRPARLIVPYASACGAAVALGALYSSASALDALLSFGAAPLGLLLIARAIARVPGANAPMRRDAAWLAAAAVIGGGFALTIARGIGRLA